MCVEEGPWEGGESAFAAKEPREEEEGSWKVHGRFMEEERLRSEEEPREDPSHHLHGERASTTIHVLTYLEY